MVGAVASLGSTEAVKKAAEQMIKNEITRRATGKVIQTATGLQLDDSREEQITPDLDKADQEFAETGDYDVYSDTGTSASTYSPPDPSTYTYEGSDEEDEASNYETPAPAPPSPVRDSGNGDHSSDTSSSSSSGGGWADDGYW